MPKNERLKALATEATQWMRAADTGPHGHHDITIKDGHPQWILDLISRAHHAGIGRLYMTADPYRIEWVYDSCKMLAEANIDEPTLTEELDQLGQVFAAGADKTPEALATWLGAGENTQRRCDYCDEYAAEYGLYPDDPPTLSSRLEMGQYIERWHVFNVVSTALEELADTDTLDPSF